MSVDVAELKARNPISDVVGSFTRLTRAGSTYRGKCPVHGGDGDNLVVYPESDSWHCFSCNCHDGHADQIGFLELMLGTDFKGVAEYLGAAHEWKPELVKPARPPMPERVTSKPPPDAGMPRMAIKGLGEPVATWEYKDTDGGTLGYVARYETETGKEIRCWTFGVRGDGIPSWGCGHWSKPRYLYALNRIHERPDSPILITEGEKACEAAQALLPGYVAVTWPGGAQAWKHADFSPLSGKTVLLWPDNDQIGVDCMSKLAQVLADPAGLACKVRIIDPSGQETGWDAADFTGTTAELVAWAKPRASDVIPTTVPDSSAAQEPIPLKPGALSLSSPAAPSLEPLEPPTGDLQPEPPPMDGATLERPPPRPRKPRKPYIAASGGNVLPEPEQDGEVLPQALTEHGAAVEFAALHKDEFRVVHEWQSKHGPMWLTWDGTRWARDPGRVGPMKRALTLAAQYQYRPEAMGMTTAGKTKFGTKKYISNFLDLAQFQESLLAKAELFDADPMYLGTPGGTVDLRIGKLIEAEREHCITRLTSVTPAPGPHPLFDMVLACASNGETAVESYLWRLLGYWLTASCQEEQFTFLRGDEGSGKGTLVKCVADILDEYAVVSDMEAFTESKDQKAPQHRAKLEGHRFTYASETNQNRKWNEAQINYMTGRDKVEGQKLWENKKDFEMTAKILIYGNYIPKLRTGVAVGLKRRLHLIEYHGKITEPDVTLKDRIKAEYPAILYDMIQGCLEWQRLGGLCKPEEISDNVTTYLSDQDYINAWTEDCLEAGGAYQVPVRELYANFKHWCTANNEFCPASNEFSKRLIARGWTNKHTRAGNAFIGWKIKPYDDERSPPSYDRD